MAIAYLPTPYMHTRYRRRRVLALLSALALLSTVYFCYRGLDTHTAVPTSAAQRLLLKPLSPADAGHKPRPAALAAAIPPMEYGTAARPPLKGIRRLATLPVEYVPKPARGSPRLLIVGDVHGQLDALRALLAEAGFDRARGDHVVFAGDMINKGPDSAGVVALAMEIGASAVRGNHEDKVLLAYTNHMQKRALQAADTPAPPAAKRGEEEKAPPAETAEEETPLIKGEGPALRTAESLTPAQRDWLAGLPVILRLGHIPNQNAGDWVVVHAGLVPGITIDNQDLHAAMNMRTLTYPARESMREEIKKSLEEQRPRPPPAGPEGGGDNKNNEEPLPPVSDAEVEAALRRAIDALPLASEVNDFSVAVPTDERTGRLWADVWNQAQAAKRYHTERTSVVYGHDSKAGLRVGAHTFGLDSGCVRGGRLTALLFEPATSLIGLPVVRHRLVSVACTKAPDV